MWRYVGCLGTVSGPRATAQGAVGLATVRALLQKSGHIRGFGLGAALISSLLSSPHQPLDNSGPGGGVSLTEGVERGLLNISLDSVSEERSDSRARVSQKSQMPQPSVLLPHTVEGTQGATG